MISLPTDMESWDTLGSLTISVLSSNTTLVILNLLRSEGNSFAKGRPGLAEASFVRCAAKVTRSALQNAASVAAMVLTTEALVTDIPEENKPATPQMPGGMGDF